MGFGGISIWQLLIILVIIVLLFGTKRLRGIGSDLGSAIKGFRNSVKDTEENADTTPPAAQPQLKAEAKDTTATTAEQPKTPEQR